MNEKQIQLITLALIEARAQIASAQAMLAGLPSVAQVAQVGPQAVISAGTVAPGGYVEAVKNLEPEIKRGRGRPKGSTNKPKIAPPA